MIYAIAQAILALSLCLSLSLAVIIFSPPINRRLSEAVNLLPWLEGSAQILGAGLAACMLILLAALLKGDPDLVYCASRISADLPLRFRAAALWAGPEGSLLCWAAGTGTAGALFTLTRHCQRLPMANALYFWGYYYLILAFFLFMLCVPASPFTGIGEAEATLEIIYNATAGSQSAIVGAGMPAGLPPSLRHVAMLFHPPLIFLGYAALVIPAALGLARLKAGAAPPMVFSSGSTGQKRHFFLTPKHEPGESSESLALRRWLAAGLACMGAGVGAGMWWAYTESGWGNYWTWDPVENMSLLPCLAAAAALSANRLELARARLMAPAGFLAVLPLAAALCATFVVRSGILISKHAYSLSLLNGYVLALPAFAGLLTVLGLAGLRRAPKGAPLNHPYNREGLTILQIFLLAALGLSLLLGSLWPLISQGIAFFSNAGGQPMHMDNAYFLKTCLPLAGLCLLCELIIATPRFSLFQTGLLLCGAGLILSSLLQQQWDVKLILQQEENMLISPHAPDTPPPLWFAGLRLRELEFSQQGEYALARLTLEKKESREETDRETGAVSLSASPAWEIALEQRAYGGQVLAKTSYRHGLAHDLGFTPLQIYPDQSALIRVKDSPFVNLIWLGTALMGLALLPVWLDRR